MPCFGASNYTFADATRAQQTPDWIQSQTPDVKYFGGVPIWVPDQLRTGVPAPCRHAAGVQRTYAERAQHYHTGRHSGRSGRTSRQGM